MRNVRGQRAHIQKTIKTIKKELPVWLLVLGLTALFYAVAGPWIMQQADIDAEHEALICDGDANCITLEEHLNGK